jgi:hypothetical protein
LLQTLLIEPVEHTVDRGAEFVDFIARARLGDSSAIAGPDDIVEFRTHQFYRSQSSACHEPCNTRASKRRKWHDGQQYVSHSSLATSGVLSLVAHDDPHTVCRFDRCHPKILLLCVMARADHRNQEVAHPKRDLCTKIARNHHPGRRESFTVWPNRNHEVFIAHRSHQCVG